jgi:hypothetical protein
MLDPRREVSGILLRPRSRCSECKKTFRPNARLRERQKTCVESVCQHKHRARYRKKYRKGNPGPEKEYRDKALALRPAGSWKNYRESHPRSSERNRLNTRLRKQLKSAGLQRQLDIVQVLDPAGHFELFVGFATSRRSLLEACLATQAA